MAFLANSNNRRLITSTPECSQTSTPLKANSTSTPTRLSHRLACRMATRHLRMPSITKLSNRAPLYLRRGRTMVVCLVHHHHHHHHNNNNNNQTPRRHRERKLQISPRSRILKLDNNSRRVLRRHHIVTSSSQAPIMPLHRRRCRTNPSVSRRACQTLHQVHSHRTRILSDR